MGWAVVWGGGGVHRGGEDDLRAGAARGRRDKQLSLGWWALGP